MADERLRRLERAAADDPEARVQWLKARVRLGDLTPLRLWLAAHLGEPAAVGALGHDDPPASFRDWVLILTGGGKETCVRAALAAARLAAIGGSAGEALDAVEAWVECPCRDHARAAGAAARRLWATPVLGEGARVAAWAASAASELHLTRAAGAAAGAILRLPGPPRDHPDYSEALFLPPDVLTPREEEALRAALAAALVPWLLASRDPLPPTELSRG